jgi:hypothetical protein
MAAISCCNVQMIFALCTTFSYSFSLSALFDHFFNSLSLNPFLLLQDTVQMAILAIASAVRHFAERHLANGNRSPGQLAAFAALGIFLAAIAKYPDRAIFVRARPDLKKKTVPGHPLVGNMIQALTSKENPLYVLKACFDEYGDLYTLTIPGRGRIFVVNNPEFIEHILKSTLVVLALSQSLS